MWRYQVEYYNLRSEGTPEFPNFLSEFGNYLAMQGQDRWELVTVTPTKTGMLLIFKKPAS